MGLDGIEIVMEVEKDFGVKLPDAEAANLLVVSQLRDAIVAHLLAEPERLPERLRRIVFLHLQTLLSEQMRLRRSTIKVDSRFIEDLGV